MKVLIADRLESSLERRLVEEAGHSIAVADPECRTPGEVIRAAADAHALVVQYSPVTAEVLEALPQLHIVSLPMIGVDAVDTEAARRHGVWVANVPDACVRETAVHAAAMALALIRHLPFLDREVRNGGWGYASTGALRRPDTLALGIVGLGRIGRHVAACTRAVFGRILGFDPKVPAVEWPDGVERFDDIAALFRNSDVVTFHVPLTGETRHLVGRELLAELRPGSYLVNASRGPVVDPKALLEALDSGRLAGAALDVFEKEPPDEDDRLRRHPRVVTTPHAAFYSVQADEEARTRAIANIIEYVRTGRPSNVIVAGTKRWSA